MVKNPIFSKASFRYVGAGNKLLRGLGPGASGSGQPKLMVVDDEPTNLCILQEGLKDRYQVATFESAAEAFDQLQEGELPALILLDVMMPVQDGLSFCRALKAHPLYQNIPVIFLTARDDDATERTCFELGAVDFIRKPFHLPVVSARINHHVAVQRLIRENMASGQRLKMVLHELRAMQLELDSLARELDYADASKILYEGAFQAASEGLAIMDAGGILLAGNPALARMLGKPLVDCLGQDFLVPDLLEPSGSERADILAALTVNDRWKGDFCCRRPNGEVYIQSRRITALRNRHGICQHFVAVVRDLSIIRQKDSDLDCLDFRDPVTGLADRTTLLKNLADALQHSADNRHSAAVILLDIRDFRTINEMHGYLGGDAVLMELAQRLSELSSPHDLVARLGSDHFGLLVGAPGLTADEVRFQARSLMVRVSQEMKRPIELTTDKRISVRLRAGVAVFPTLDVNSAPAILQQAEVAHQSARSSGRELVFYQASGHQDLSWQQSLEGELLDAVDREELVLFAQGQFTAQGNCTGYEVLVRWEHPELGLLEPDRFIPFAETTRLVLTLERYILHRAFEIVGFAGEKASHLDCSVNVSARHLCEPDFVDIITSLIARTGADPNRIVLEMTETVTVDDLGVVSGKMAALTELGIRFSLDDFGTGYSSLSRLHRLPISEIKIDRGFVNDAPDNPASGRIVNMISHIGQSLGLDVVAEGIETQEHQQFFAEHYPHIRLQGFYYGSPCPLKQFLIQL